MYHFCTFAFRLYTPFIPWTRVWAIVRIYERRKHKKYSSLVDGLALIVDCTVVQWERIAMSVHNKSKNIANPPAPPKPHIDGKGGTMGKVFLSHMFDIRLRTWFTLVLYSTVLFLSKSISGVEEWHSSMKREHRVMQDQSRWQFSSNLDAWFLWWCRSAMSLGLLCATFEPWTIYSCCICTWFIYMAPTSGMYRNAHIEVLTINILPAQHLRAFGNPENMCTSFRVCRSA